MTNTLSINELLPTGEKIRKIQTGSELLLAYELNKYAQLMLGKEVALTDVTIAKELFSGEHFSFVVMNGLNVGFVPERETLADITKNARYFFPTTVEGVAFVSVTPEKVVYKFDHDTNANKILHGDNRGTSYVSLVAYLMVKAKAEGVAIPKLVIDHETYNQRELEYVELMLLQHYGNRVLKNLIEVKYATNWGFQPEWEAFLLYNRQRGLMNTEYSVPEKQKHLRKNFQIGDVVLMYQRTRGAKGKTVNQLKACYPAVIKGFTANGVTLTYYPIVQTEFTRHMELNDVSQNLEDDDRTFTYREDDYSLFNACTTSFPFTSIGVGTATWTEECFFIKPVDFDGSYQFFRTKEGIRHLFLSTLDTIYAVFEDRKVEYNREAFLQEHFHSKNRTPIYDQYVPLQENA